jgi:hypothetical protein
VANKKVVDNSGLDERSHLKWGLKNVNDILSWDGRISLLGTLSDMMGIQYTLHLRLG